MKKKRLKRIVIFSLVFSIIVVNAVAYFHAYKFTHFDTSKKIKTNKPEGLSISEKVLTLIFGIGNPNVQCKLSRLQSLQAGKLEVHV